LKDCLVRIFASTTSPYARKVRIVLIERGLGREAEIIWASPFEQSAGARALQAANPLRKIPALLIDDLPPIYDSRVICELLDALGGGTPLLPADPIQRAVEQTRMALADGIMDASFNLVMELRRPAHQQSEAWKQRWTDNVRTALERTPAPASGRWGLAEIGLVCAIDYIAFRLPEADLVPPALLDWRDEQGGRPSVAQTFPRDAVGDR
jgi:glutathione S-transferase